MILQEFIVLLWYIRDAANKEVLSGSFEVFVPITCLSMEVALSTEDDITCEIDLWRNALDLLYPYKTQLCVIVKD